jgi:hypothetical protein
MAISLPLSPVQAGFASLDRHKTIDLKKLNLKDGFLARKVTMHPVKPSSPSGPPEW